MLSIKEINLLEAQNEGLKKQNADLQKENAKLKQELDAYQISENEANEIIVELKAENERLKEEIKEVKKYQYQQEYLDKEIEEMQKALKTLAEGLNIRQQTLQEIKAIAEELLEKGLEPQSVEHQLRLRGKRELASIIIDLITKAESEDNQ